MSKLKIVSTMLPFFSITIFFHLLSILTSSATCACLCVGNARSARIVSSNSSELLYEVLPFIKVYKDGTVERLSGTETLPPSYDRRTNVQSKDVHVSIAPNLTISARLYLPGNDVVACNELPLLVYFHGGGFFTESPFSPTYHHYLNSLVSEAKAVAVSVNYRLAPENPLPIGYQDSWLALKWVLSHSKGSGDEPWLNDYADFGRVYLGGDSAGANIAHNVAIRVGSEKTDIRLHGMFLNCPHFWGTERIGNEAGQPKGVAWVESIWIHAYPDSTGFDDPASNPGMDPDLWKLGCGNVVVYVAEYDVLRDRGFYYEEVLERSGWVGKIKVVEVKGEDHVFNLNFPNSTKAKKMLKQLALFINNN